MSDWRASMEIKFPMDGSKPTIRSNVKREHWEEILETYLRAQAGAGEDLAEPEKHDEYLITIQIDLEDNTYSKHNCGNKGLRDGILMSVLKAIREGAVEEA